MFVKYLILFFISMVPIVELRGAIPYSVVFGLPLIPSYIICVIGNMLPVPFIYLFARKILIWGSDKKGIGKFFRFCLEKGEKGGQKLKEKAGVAESKIFPHNFRHLFARIYYKVTKDITGLADLLGHSSINVTRIYTATTETVFQKKLDKIVEQEILECTT